MSTYTYDIEDRALPVSSYRVFETREEAEEAVFEIVFRHGIEIDTVNWRRSDAQTAAAVWEAGGSRAIYLPNNDLGRSIITILHEIAHLATGLNAPSAHGQEWVGWFRYLLHHEVSVTASAALDFEMQNYQGSVVLAV